MYQLLRNFILPTLIAVFFTDCGSSVSSKETDFSRPSVIATELTPLKLARSQDIPHRILRKTVITGKYFFDSHFYDVEFPSLSESEFRRLQKIYGGWSKTRNQETYQSDKVWNLSQFLPPAMASKLGNVFQGEETLEMLPHIFGSKADGQRIPTPVQLISNCWGTAYEVMRAAQTPSEELILFYAPQRLAKAVFFDPQWSEEIRPISKTVSPDPSVRSAGLMPGDVLLIGDAWLQHVAIFVDDDLYFEKSGTGNTALYRLNTLETILATWPPDLHGYSWRRFHSRPLPQPSELFNLRTSLPSNIDLSLFTEAEQRGLTAELNYDDRTGEPIGATWLGMRRIPLPLVSGHEVSSL